MASELLLRLPVDILHLALIAYSTPSLWSSIRLGPVQLQYHKADEGAAYLRTRLERAGTLPLTISIGPVSPRVAGSYTVSSLCTTVSGYSTRIYCLEVSAETSNTVGGILEDIFFPFPTAVFPALEVLSVRMEDEFSEYSNIWPYVDQVLEDAANQYRCPMLHTLSLPSFYGCVPLLRDASRPFDRLRVLILDGSLEQDVFEPKMAAIVLQYTPQLETLWFKHHTIEHVQPGGASELFLNGIEEVTFRTPVHLPCLAHLAISMPGSAADLIEYIRAPALCYLHIDGSRGPGYNQTERLEYKWANDDTNSTQRALRCLSRYSPNVRHLAVTSVYLTRAGWEWLLLRSGDDGPFPLLESLSLHGHEVSSGGVACGFDNALLRRYAACEPRLGLRRLVLFRCNLAFDGSLIVEVFRKAVAVDGRESYELEFDSVSVRFLVEELVALERLGVKLIKRQGGVKEDEWWSRGHQIDAFDWHAY
ncbi:hypothetical protein AX15_006965 [Amanita polypyramis BW_CC]|nr:hypothetical protein AX15_006965 [Amanita polypyramis BW_CC]